MPLLVTYAVTLTLHSRISVGLRCSSGRTDAFGRADLRLFLGRSPNSCSPTKLNLPVFTLLRTLLHAPIVQPPCFQQLLHSFAKTPGWGYPPRSKTKSARPDRPPRDQDPRNLSVGPSRRALLTHFRYDVARPNPVSEHAKHGCGLYLQPAKKNGCGLYLLTLSYEGQPATRK